MMIQPTRFVKGRLHGCSRRGCEMAWFRQQSRGVSTYTVDFQCDGFLDGTFFSAAVRTVSSFLVSQSHVFFPRMPLSFSMICSVVSRAVGCALSTEFALIGGPDACAESTSTKVSPSTPAVSSKTVESAGDVQVVLRVEHHYYFNWRFLQLGPGTYGPHRAYINSRKTY
jgi:hypothetical protein